MFAVACGCAGTLTQNKLSLNDPILIGDMTAKELVFYAALASKRGGGQDAIDFCICQALPADDKCVPLGVGCVHSLALALPGVPRRG
jgi:hypothetical protein